MKLDKTDVEILRILQDDSRTSFRILAKKIGISVPTVSARVARLEKLGIIRSYTANINADKLGETTLLLTIKCKPKSVKEVAKSLASMLEARKVFVLREPRVIVEAVLPNADAIDAFLEKCSVIDGLTDYEYHVVTSRLKDEPSATINDSLIALLECSECHKTIEGDAIKRTLGDKDYYFCCRSCDKLFTEKFNRIRAGI